MNILAYFSNNGIPATGLTIPTIKIREVPIGTLLVNNASMTEVGDGFYSYDFTTYDLNKDYAIVCDGTAALSDSDRYTYAGNENYIDDINNTITVSTSGNFDDINTNISQINTNVLSVSASIVDINNDIKRLLGLVHENIFIDQPTYDSYGNMDSARLRIYSNPGSVGTDSDVIGTYEISAPSTSPGQFTSWKQIRIS